MEGMAGMNFAFSLSAYTHKPLRQCAPDCETAARADWCYRARAQRSTHAYQARDLSVVFVLLELRNKGHCTHLICLEPVFRDHRDHELSRQGNHHHEKLAQVPGTLLLNLENLCRILRYLKNLHGLVRRRCAACVCEHDGRQRCSQDSEPGVKAMANCDARRPGRQLAPRGDSGLTYPVLPRPSASAVCRHQVARRTSPRQC